MIRLSKLLIKFYKARTELGCISQVLANVTETEPLTRSASIRTVAAQSGRVELLDNTESREPLCAQHAGGMALARDKSLHLASQLRALCDQAAGTVTNPDARMVFAASGNRSATFADGLLDASLRGLRDSSLRGLRDLGAGVRARTPEQGRGRSPERPRGSSPERGDDSLTGRVVDCSAHGPRVLDRALEKASGGLMEVLNQGSGVELWCENRCAWSALLLFAVQRAKAVNVHESLCGGRYASLERYLAFLVVFHEMAARVAAFTPLRFDVSRSQSQLRVATTAAPISAAELEREWASDGTCHPHDFLPSREVMPDPTLHVPISNSGQKICEAGSTLPTR